MVDKFPDCSLYFYSYENYVCHHSQVSFPSGTTREKGILDLIHSNVFGRVSIPSLGGSMYYVSFIVDFSRKVWLYLLKRKLDVFEKIKDFKALMENQMRKKISVSRIENGGELYGK